MALDRRLHRTSVRRAEEHLLEVLAALVGARLRHMWSQTMPNVLLDNACNSFPNSLRSKAYTFSMMLIFTGAVPHTSSTTEPPRPWQTKITGREGQMH